MALIDIGDTWQQDLDTAERLHKTILCQVELFKIVMTIEFV
jgi:hypothetical protein